MKLVVVIPTYNEAKNIKKLLENLFVVLDQLGSWNPQVLVVDDSSPDGTGEDVLRLAKKNKKIHLLARSRKTGLGAAYFAGMKEAFERMHADVVLIMDADLSHEPAYIPDFLQKIKEGADFIVGSRYIPDGEIAKGWAPHRKALSVFGNLITRLLLWSNSLADWTSGYRAIRKEVFLKVAPKLSDFRGYTFNISFAYFAVESGFKVGEVPIKFIDRTEGKSKLGFEYLYHTPIFLLKTRLNALVNSILKKK